MPNSAFSQRLWHTSTPFCTTTTAGDFSVQQFHNILLRYYNQDSEIVKLFFHLSGLLCYTLLPDRPAQSVFTWLCIADA